MGAHGGAPLRNRLVCRGSTPCLPFSIEDIRKGAHTGVRPYSTALPVGADPRVCPAKQKPT